MAISYTIAQHAVAMPSKVLAAEGGKHIYNIHLTEDVDNGNFVARGAWEGLDLYTQAAATEFEGIVREQAANGNWYVEVTNPGDALFVHNPVVIEEEYSKKFLTESNWYNAKGDVVRGYELAIGDVVEISDLGFTEKPALAAGQDYVVVLSGKKLAKKAVTPTL